MTFFYIANIIGYVRILCLFAATAFSAYPTSFMTFYVASYALDAVDGPVARAVDGTSKLGAVMDMVTDRSATAVLLALLNDPIWLAFLILDISAHWVHTSASLASGKDTHKDSVDPLLKWYYKRTNLFFVCFASEAFLCGTYLIKNHIQFPLEILLLLCPAFFLKQAISVVHLVRGAQELASLG